MLNKEQQQAVHITEGPLRIIAGVGTGKTFILINRIDYLIKEKKVLPRRILALTFTNKAAHELKSRLKEMGHIGVLATTFHSLAARLLRKFWNQDFKVIDSRRQKELLSEILQKQEKDKFRDLIADLDLLRQSKVLGKPALKAHLEEVLSKYEAMLVRENALDFGALLTGLLWLWKDKPEILSKCQALYDYILVDEYQDVNEVQVEILRLLAQSHKNICVVGDEDQTIYSWRGARAETMKEFVNLFENTNSIVLLKNYRNPPAILKGAQALIGKKDLEPVISSDGKINFWESNARIQQCEQLFHLLENYLGSHSAMHMADELDGEGEFRPFSDIALLYRTQEQGKFLAEELTKKGYPYQISSGQYFWEQNEIVKFVEELEKLQNLEDFGEKKFSDWISDRVEDFIESGKFTETKKSRLCHLVSYSMQFNDLRAFLDEVKTEQDADNLVFADRISLLTLHASKGLEFPIVMIFGLEEGLIPHKKSDLAEEKRLLYVGMTRAREELHLFCNTKQKKSRFLDEIGEKNMVYMSLPERRAQKLKRRELKEAQMKLF